MAVVRGESENQDGTWTKTYTYYATDHLGTVRFDYKLDASGNVLSQSVHDYSPFGVEIGPVETSDNTHKYTGQERDPETGNDYMHYRFYGDSIGRFMKPDNVSGTLENPQDWNLYSYTHGNPISFDDPTGHIATNPNIGPGNQEELHRSEDLFESTGDGVDLVAGWGENAFMNIVTTNVYDANDNLLASVSVETVESTPLIPTTSSTSQRATQAGKKYNRNVLEAGYHIPHIHFSTWEQATYKAISGLKVGELIPNWLVHRLEVIGYELVRYMPPQQGSPLPYVESRLKVLTLRKVVTIRGEQYGPAWWVQEPSKEPGASGPSGSMLSLRASDLDVFMVAPKHDWGRSPEEMSIFEGKFILH